jgi:hypothetical protein
MSLCMEHLLLPTGLTTNYLLLEFVKGFYRDYRIVHMLHSDLTIAHCNWQLKNLSLFTTVRVIFQLTEEMPCISAVVVALLSKVRVHFSAVFLLVLWRLSG